MYVNSCKLVDRSDKRYMYSKFFSTILSNENSCR